MQSPRYDAFISYRRSDGSKVAQWLRGTLQGFRPPKRLRKRYPRRLQIYLDTAYERGTADFYNNTIKPALLDSRWLIIVATPDAVLRTSASADWIMNEVTDFSTGPHAGNIIVVRGKGDFDGALPADLAQRYPNVQIVDLRGVGRFWFLNPLKASRISNELLKLVAPVLDVAPDDMPILRQEEERRQQSRLGATFGATTAVAAAIVTLAVFAIISRYQAQAALKDSIYSLSQLVRQSYSTFARDDPSNEQRDQLAVLGCDLITKLDGTAGERAPVNARSVCLMVQGDGRLEQGEYDVAEQNYRAALSMLAHAFTAQPSEQLGYAGLHVRQALARLYRAKGDAAGRMRELEALEAEAERLIAFKLPPAGPNGVPTDLFAPKERLYRQVAAAKVELADLARVRKDTTSRARLLAQASAAYQAAEPAPTKSGAPSTLADPVLDALARRAEVELQRASLANDAKDTNAVKRHIQMAIALRQRISGSTRNRPGNDVRLGRLYSILAKLQSDPAQRVRALDQAEQRLRAAMQQPNLRLVDARTASRLLKDIKAARPPAQSHGDRRDQDAGQSR